MSIYILDTGTLLGYVRGAKYAEYVEEKYSVSSPPNIAFVSVVTIGEIYSLAMQFGWGKNKMERLRKIIEKIPYVDINHQKILEKYAEVDAYSQGKHPSLKLQERVSSRNMGKNDIWIAATGSVLNATLLSIDHDFDHLNDVFLNVIYIDQKSRREDIHAE